MHGCIMHGHDACMCTSVGECMGASCMGMHVCMCVSMGFGWSPVRSGNNVGPLSVPDTVKS
jgi:hypothetical protein